MAYSTVADVEIRLGEDTGMDSTINAYIAQADTWIDNELTGFTTPNSVVLLNLSADYAASCFLNDLYAPRSIQDGEKAKSLMNRAEKQINSAKRSDKTYVVQVNG